MQETFESGVEQDHMGRVRLALTALFLLVSAFAHSQHLLVDVNEPERVSSSGVSAYHSVLPGDKVRFFVHLHNVSSTSQRLAISGPDSTWSMACGCDSDPSAAGYQSAAHFMNNPVSVKGDIAWAHWIPKGWTVTVVLDATAKSAGAIQVVMGKGLVQEHLRRGTCENTTTVQIKSASARLSYRVGAMDFDGKGGEYGRTVDWVVHNELKTPEHVDVWVSPRGGPAPLVFMANGKMVGSKSLIAPGTRWKVASFDVAPDQTINCRHIVQGGISYPIEMRFVWTPKK